MRPSITLLCQAARRYVLYHKQSISHIRTHASLSNNMLNCLPGNRLLINKMYMFDTHAKHIKQRYSISFMSTHSFRSICTSSCLNYCSSATEKPKRVVKSHLFDYRNICTTSGLNYCSSATEKPKRVVKEGKLGMAMLFDLLDKPDTYVSYDDWMKIKLIWDKENRLTVESGHVVFMEKAMSVICTNKSWQLANSLFNFAIKCDFKFTQPFMNSYLHICVATEKRDDVLNIYKWFMENSTLLSAAVLKNIVNGLCLTDMWKESLKLLDTAKGTAQYSNSTFNSVVCAACFHKEFDLIEDLFDQMIADGDNMFMLDKTIIALLRAYDGKDGDADWGQRCKSMVERMMLVFRDKRTLSSMSVAEALQEWFNNVKFERWEAKIIKIDNKHNCPQCQSPLETLELTDAEFKNLHKQVIEKVIHGTDIFRKTSPRELQAFMKFVDEGAPYDVVVDGLNVALVQFNKTRRPSQLLLFVVQHLVEKHGYKCLVLGRRHMIKQWNKSDMKQLMDCADCFFTDDVSEDDPFMLYATLHSGTRAVFVTRDMFRDHKALLDYDTYVSFIKWQRGHQLTFINFKRGKPYFKACRVEDTITQTTGDTWHIPVDAGDNQFAYQLPTTWLCARRT